MKNKRILFITDRDNYKPMAPSVVADVLEYGYGGNTGNMLFQYAIQKLLCAKPDIYNLTDFYYGKDISEKINSDYDCLIFAPANLLSVFAIREMTILSTIFSKIKIPIVCVSLGAQSNSNYSKDFIKTIKEPAISFIKSILATGTKIGLRGYFSLDVVKELGFSESDFQVIGCPALYIKGRNLSVKKRILQENELNPIFNGFRFYNDGEARKYLEKYQNSVFVCQDEFFRLIHCPKELKYQDMRYALEQGFVNLRNSNKIKIYGDIFSWYNEIRNGGFNFSYGCRFHGNIVPILNGIPAFIDSFDSRTKELAEYFNIPNLEFEKTPDPYMLYQDCDYSKFNEAFAQKYDCFEKFMNDNGLEINSEEEIPVEFEKIEIKKLEKIKVCFVAHEFGNFPGHGGIASYLHEICKFLIENNFDVTVLSLPENIDANCELLKSDNFNVVPLHGNLDEKRLFVYRWLKENPQAYVEFADYLALGLECVRAKKKNNREFLRYIFVTNNHTATREIFEWNDENFSKDAPEYKTFLEEKEQLELSDYCFAPSAFLADYVKKHYGLKNNVLVFANPFLSQLKNQEDIRKELFPSYNLEEYQDKFNIVLITRFERRKCQERIVKAVQNLLLKNIQIRLILVGNSTIYKDTDYRSYIYNMCRQSSDILIYDFMGIAQQEKFIAISDLTVMPSTYENQPLAMLESVFRGVPVMGSKYSGIADYTFDENMLFDPFDEFDLQNKIEKFIGLPQSEKKQIADRQKKNLLNFIEPGKSILNRFTLPIPMV